MAKRFMFINELLSGHSQKERGYQIIDCFGRGLFSHFQVTPMSLLQQHPNTNRLLTKVTMYRLEIYVHSRRTVGGSELGRCSSLHILKRKQKKHKNANRKLQQLLRITLVYFAHGTTGSRITLSP